MKIRTHNDETVRKIVLRVEDGATLESGLNNYRVRPQRFQVQVIHIWVEFPAGQPEITHVSVDGPLMKKDGTLSDMVRDGDSWGWTKRGNMPAWLAKLVVEAVDGQTRWEVAW